VRPSVKATTSPTCISCSCSLQPHHLGLRNASLSSDVRHMRRHSRLYPTHVVCLRNLYEKKSFSKKRVRRATFLYKWQVSGSCVRDIWRCTKRWYGLSRGHIFLQTFLLSLYLNHSNSFLKVYRYTITIGQWIFINLRQFLSTKIMDTASLVCDRITSSSSSSSSSR